MCSGDGAHEVTRPTDSATRKPQSATNFVPAFFGWRWVGVLAAVIYGIGVSEAQPGLKTWANNSSSTSFVTSGNWSPSGAPATTDNALFDGTTSSRQTTIGISMASGNNGSGSEVLTELQLTGGKALTLGNSGSTVDGTLRLDGNSGVALQNTSTFLLTLQPQAGGSKNMAVAFGNSGLSVDITGSGGITISSGITGNNGFTKTSSGAGVLTFSGANTYSGDTTISAGTLALSGSSTIPSTSVNLTIAGGATFDVSATTAGFTMDSAQTLKASGNGSSGTIATTTSKGLTLGATSGLQFTAYNGSTAPLTVTGAGSMTLASGNSVTVTVPGSALTAADYVLIAKGTGNTTAANGTAPASVTVNGTGGLASGTTASLVISGGQLFLHVTASGNTAPTVTTQAASSPSTSGATLNGTVTANGGASLTDRGFYWKTSSGVTTSDNQLSEGGTSVAAFSKAIGGLSVNTIYYYRAYAANSVAPASVAVTSVSTHWPTRLSAPSVGSPGATPSMSPLAEAMETQR